MKEGLPEFKFPPFSAEVKNETQSFFNMVSSLGSAPFVVPLLAILENIALAKVFGMQQSYWFMYMIKIKGELILGHRDTFFSQS